MSREAFEAWISENDEHPRACMKDSDGQYAFPSVRNAYFIWQAARAAALEEAAEVCRKLAEEGSPDNWEYGSWDEFDDAVQAILALKEKE